MYQKLHFAILLCFIALFTQPFKAGSQIITTIAGCGIGDDSIPTKAELFYPHSVAVDTVGNVYIAEAQNHRIRKVIAGGTKIFTIAGNGISGFSGDGGPATAAELSGSYGITVDKAGNVYFSDNGNSCVRKINSSGIISTVAGDDTAGYAGDSGPATAAELYNPIGLAFDTSGNLFIADAENRCIRMVNTSGIISTVAGNGTPGYSGDDGPATLAQLYDPYFVNTDRTGNIYISDYLNNRVRKVNASGIITTIAGTGVGGYSGDGGPATAAEIREPEGIFTDDTGNIYFSDHVNFRIRKIDNNGIINTIAGKGIPGFGGDGGPADSAKFCSTTGICMDKAGNIFIADTWNGRVRKINAAGIITTYAGQSGLFDDGIPATNAELGAPDNVATDTFGNVYVPDYYNERIRKIDTSGIITTVAGNGSSGAWDPYSGDGGVADSAQILYPTAVAVDMYGNIYIADSYNERIRKVNASGIITTIAGNGIPGFSGDGGPATAAEINTPSGVAVDNAGNVYIADADNSRIRKINDSGIITTVAGNGVFGYSGDGHIATHAAITPGDVAVDASGNIYIADQNNNRIRRVDTSNIITTIAGNGIAGFTGDGGPATVAQLNDPGGVKVDVAGNVYIADDRNNAIRMVNAKGIITTIAGNGIAGFSGDGGPATAARLNVTAGVAVDKWGDIYIADGDNFRIRKVNNCSQIAVKGDVLPVTCYGYSNGSISVNITGGSGSYQYLWSNDTAQPDITRLNAGPYTFHITDRITQCTATDSFTVTQPDSLQITTDIKNDECKTGNGSISINASGGAPPYSYQWPDNTTGTTLENLMPNAYTVLVTDGNNCQKNESIVVGEDTCAPIIVHDVITPNGDGINDVLEIEGIQNYPKNTLQIFDKLGDMVYSKDGYNNNWGGVGNKDELLPDGTYNYLLKLNAENGTKGGNVFTGAILIKR